MAHVRQQLRQQARRGVQQFTGNMYNNMMNRLNYRFMSMLGLNTMDTMGMLLQNQADKFTRRSRFSVRFG